MKILYLTDQLYLHGGIEKVLSQKANWLADKTGYEVHIITYAQKGKPPVYPFSNKIQFEDLGVNYEIGRSYFHPVNLKKIPRHIFRLKTAIRRIQPDIIISCSFGPDFYFLPWIEKRIPKIKEFHATRYFRINKSLKEKLLKRLEIIAEQNYDQLIILNEDERKFYTLGKVTVIPNPTEIYPDQCKLQNRKIISAGRISYQKNYEDLIDAFSIISQEFPDWEVHIYGDDYLNKKDELLNKINSKNLQKQITFQGTTKNLKSTFLDYSIYAMTSNHETFPMVLLEALSVGLPIVSYDCPTGPNRIVTQGIDGFITPYKNITEFAEKLKQLMENEELRILMGENAKKNSKRFDISEVMKQWNELFLSLKLND